MLSFIEEKEDIWQYLKRTNKPIALYGMGDGADKIIAELAKYDLEISGVFASDERVRYQEFHGFTVKKFSELQAKIGDFITLLSFGTHLAGVIEAVNELANKTELLVPDLPITGEEIFNMAFLEKNQFAFEYAYAIWEDEISREIFANLLNFKLSGKLKYLDMPHSIPDVAPWDTTDDETYVDIGAYSGDTLIKFLQATEFKYDKIYALEPDPYSFNKLKNQVDILELEQAVILNLAAWDKQCQLQFTAKKGRGSTIGEGIVIEADSIDNILDGESASLIKIDAEGAEEKILYGARETIDVDQPKMIVSAYHRSSDLYLLPALLINLNPSYQLFLRKGKAYPCWEVNIYAK